MNSHFWDGQWREGSGDPLRSTDPAHGTLLWEGQAATAADVDAAVGAAREAAPAWGRRPLDARIALAEALQVIKSLTRLNQEQNLMRKGSIPKFEEALKMYQYLEEL